jgi:hypothetical protein
MHEYDVVLFAHIAVVVVTFMVAAILHIGLFQMRSATQTSVVKSWVPIVHRLEPLFPILALAIFGFGAWLIHLSDGEWSWSQGWIIAAIVGLALIEVNGGAILGRRSKVLMKAAEAAPDGPVSPELHALTVDRTIWVAANVNTFAALAIVYVMTNKPSGLGSTIAIVIGAIIGAVLALPFVNVAADKPLAAPATP